MKRLCDTNAPIFARPRSVRRAARCLRRCKVIGWLAWPGQAGALHLASSSGAVSGRAARSRCAPRSGVEYDFVKALLCQAYARCAGQPAPPRPAAEIGSIWLPMAKWPGGHGLPFGAMRARCRSKVLPRCFQQAPRRRHNGGFMTSGASRHLAAVLVVHARSSSSKASRSRS